MLIPEGGSVHVRKLRPKASASCSGKEDNKMEIESLDWLFVDTRKRAELRHRHQSADSVPGRTGPDCESWLISCPTSCRTGWRREPSGPRSACTCS